MTETELKQSVLTQILKATDELIRDCLDEILLAANDEENSGKLTVNIRHQIDTNGKTPEGQTTLSYNPKKVSIAIKWRTEDPDQLPLVEKE